MAFPFIESCYSHSKQPLKSSGFQPKHTSEVRAYEDKEDGKNGCEFKDKHVKIRWPQEELHLGSLESRSEMYAFVYIADAVKPGLWLWIRQGNVLSRVCVCEFGKVVSMQRSTCSACLDFGTDNISKLSLGALGMCRLLLRLFLEMCLWVKCLSEEMP